MISFEELRNLMMNARTVRRFKGDRDISVSTLESLVELVRYTPSGRNAQPLKYCIVTNKELREKIYPLLKWAGYYSDWDGPVVDERPTAYIIQCLDTKYGNNCLCDDGLEWEAINLGMRTEGLAGCIIKAFNAPELEKVLNLEERYQARYVYAVGYPAEEVKLEDMDGSEDADFKYFRTADSVHHVPKRPLSERLLLQK